MTALGSWNDTPTRRAIVDFVEGTAQQLPAEERVAVFDNDGTLWCEKPMPIELGFILRRLAEMAEVDESLRGRQPWKAAREQDYAWLGNVFTKHYGGDETDVQVLLAGILQAFAGVTVDAYTEAAGGRSRPALRLLVAHDDAAREFAYTAGAEQALERAGAEGWTVVSVKDDWATVFAD